VRRQSINKHVITGLVPVIHVSAAKGKTWMAGTSPAMTNARF
jgi:hypothetical protein